MSDRFPVSMTVAAIAMGACALGGIAYYAGWFPRSGAPETTLTKSFAQAPAPVKTPTAPSDIALAPGESLVTAPEPVPAEVKPTPAPRPAAAKKPSKPKYAKAAPARKPPTKVAKRNPAPQYAQAATRPATGERSSHRICATCAVVTGMSHYDDEWEVRVRFDDGTRKALRSVTRPRVEIGDFVHFERDKLVRADR
jgi:hypothetical protein